MSREFEICGCIEVPDEVTADEATDALIKFFESKGWYFGGGLCDVTDGNDRRQEESL